MNKISNKRTLITLTIVAILTLLAQPVQAIRILPHYLCLRPIEAYSELNEESKFTWRGISGQTGDFRVLTVEKGDADLLSDSKIKPEPIANSETNTCILPYRLAAKHDYQEGLNLSIAVFHLRKFNRNGTIFDVVTIEDNPLPRRFDHNDDLSPTYEFIPFDLVGTADFRSGLKQYTRFNWRSVKMTDNIVYRAVTLED